MKTNNIITIMRKEFARFFKDRRMVLTSLILPGLMIYLIYSFMGTAFGSLFGADENYIPRIYVSNLPVSVGSVLQQADITVETVRAADIDQIKERVAASEADLLIVFPIDFDEAVAAYDVTTATGAAPNIDLFYNSTSNNSYNAYQTVASLLDSYESALTNLFDINHGSDTYDLATKKDSTGQLFSMLLPLLLIMFMFSGCMGIAPESIAGEKERGTIATILVTPIKRSELAIGKILSLAVLAFLCGLSSTIGTVLSLPKLMAMDSMSIDVAAYSWQDYLYLGVIILATVLVLITILAILSAFAKTVKEATSLVMPLMIVVMLVGVSGMFGSAPSNPMLYAVPVYNSVQCMVSIFSFNVVPIHILITVICNIVYACIGGFVLTRMFNSEKIVFSK